MISFLISICLIISPSVVIGYLCGLVLICFVHVLLQQMDLVDALFLFITHFAVTTLFFITLVFLVNLSKNDIFERYDELTTKSILLEETNVIDEDFIEDVVEWNAFVDRYIYEFENDNFWVKPIFLNWLAELQPIDLPYEIDVLE